MKKNILIDLVKLADTLDTKGLSKEAQLVDKLIKQASCQCKICGHPDQNVSLAVNRQGNTYKNVCDSCYVAYVPGHTDADKIVKEKTKCDICGQTKPHETAR